MNFSEQKRAVIEALLPLCPFIHVLGDSPTVKGLPAALIRPDLVLRLGRDPRVLGMPDLVLDAKGFSCTISVAGVRSFVQAPWEAVSRMWVGEPFTGPIVVWPHPMQAAAPAPDPKPTLRLV